MTFGTVRVAGETWPLVIEPDPLGPGECFEFETTGGCGFEFGDRQLAVEVMNPSDDPCSSDRLEAVAYGLVDPRAASVEVVDRRGRSLRAKLYSLPRVFRERRRFFFRWAPGRHDIVAVLSRDGTGGLRMWVPTVSPQPRPTGACQ